jgi:hypothetical protein
MVTDLVKNSVGIPVRHVVELIAQDFLALAFNQLGFALGYKFLVPNLDAIIFLEMPLVLGSAIYHSPVYH